MMAKYIAVTRRLFPGGAAALVIAFAAIYLSGQYGAPVMLFALLLGMAMNFMYDQEVCCPGINFVSSAVLRLGVALLGLRITLEQVQTVGAPNLLVIALGIVLTISLGALLARWLKRSTEFGVLTGGSVAICGASAALAIATVLPGHPEREKQVVFTVLSVTTLSTVAMVIYPLLIALFALDDQAIGLFLGGTIHDVAQVVGAGYSVSPEVGDFATITKLFRVLMLIPVFGVLLLLFRNGNEAHGKLPFPWFIVGFVMCLLLVSFDLLPAAAVETGVGLSQFCLVTAIAALGMKTKLSVLLKGSAPALAMVVLETLFLGGLILAWVVVV
jgi:uncharacterized integral membrane protein (TIGR00698 family)